MAVAKGRIPKPSQSLIYSGVIRKVA